MLTITELTPDMILTAERWAQDDGMGGTPRPTRSPCSIGTSTLSCMSAAGTGPGRACGLSRRGPTSPRRRAGRCRDLLPAPAGQASQSGHRNRGRAPLPGARPHSFNDPCPGGVSIPGAVPGSAA